MSAAVDGKVIGFGDEELTPKRLRRPIITSLHLLFRATAILTYIFSTWYTNSFIVCFLIILCLLCADFWVVKNVSGRLLVGLRWWNYIDDEGASKWKFESSKDSTRYSELERKIFWGALIAGPLVWMLFFLVAFFSFKWSWLMIVMLGICMNGANLYGYLRCVWSSRQDVSNYMSKMGIRWMLTRDMGSLGTDAGQTK